MDTVKKKYQLEQDATMKSSVSLYMMIMINKQELNTLKNGYVLLVLKCFKQIKKKWKKKQGRRGLIAIKICVMNMTGYVMFRNQDTGGKG